MTARDDSVTIKNARYATYDQVSYAWFPDSWGPLSYQDWYWSIEARWMTLQAYLYE